MDKPAMRVGLLFGFLVLMPVLAAGGTLLSRPGPTSTQLVNDIVAKGHQAFGHCRSANELQNATATSAVIAIEAYRRGWLEAAAENALIAIFPDNPGAFGDISLGPAQITVNTVAEFGRGGIITAPEIAKRLVRDECWAIHVASEIMSRRIAACRAETASLDCATAAAAGYNGQKTLTGANFSYQIMYRRVFDRLAAAPITPR